LPSGDGNKVVQVRYRDKAGNISNVASGSIMLDTVPPTSPKIITQSKKVDANSIKIKLGVLSSDPAPSSGMKYECKDSDGVWRECTFDSNNERTYTLVQDSENRLGVRAVDGAGNYSAEDFVIIVEDSTAPEPPANIKVISGNTRAIIKWDPSPSSDVAGYKIYYGPAPGVYNGNFATEGPSPINVGNRTDYGLSSLVNGSVFYITVTAYDNTEEPKPNESTQPGAEYVLPNEVTPELAALYDSNGSVEDVYVVNGYAYVADGNMGLKIYNITDPYEKDGDKALIGSVDTAGYAYGIYVYGRYAYVADGSNGVVIVNVSDPSSPSIVNTISVSNLDARSVFVNGKYAYVADYGSGRLLVFDVSDISNPSLSKVISTVGYPYDVYSTGSRVYLANGGGLVVVDLSDLNNPVVKYIDLHSSSRGVYVSGKYAYVASGAGGLKIVDVSDINNLSLAGDIVVGGYAQKVQVVGGIAYVASGENGLQIVDVSDVNRPELVGSYQAPDYSMDLSVSGNFAYLADRMSGLMIIELCKLTTPNQMGEYRLPMRGGKIYVSGNYALMGSSTDESTGKKYVNIIDISNPESPILASIFEIPEYLDDVVIQNNYAYLAEGLRGLQIVDIGDPYHPVGIATYDTPGDVKKVYVSGNYAFLADEQKGLFILDIKEPNNPVLVSNTLEVGWTIQDVFVEGNYAYVGDWNNKLAILDIKNPVKPSLISQIATSGNVVDVYVYGTYAYIANQSGGLQIIDISNPQNPVEVSTYLSSIPNKQAKNLFVSGNYAYLIYGDDGLHIIDISKPENPILKFKYSPYNSSYYFFNTIFVSGNRAYLGIHNLGLKILNLEP
jgi:hypothetical protein